MTDQTRSRKVGVDPRELQIPPPKSWQVFEDLLHALFMATWDDPNTQKNGRQGQSQHGVDVYGSPRRDHARVEGVQAKGKDAAYGAVATVKEFNAELAKAERFDPPLSHWTFATTGPSDGRLQEHARMVSAARVSRGKFPVTSLGWEEIVQRLCNRPEILARFYPNHAFDVPTILERLEAMANQSGRAPWTAPGAWRDLDFSGERDIGPALLGRPLGPADAAACPRLNEADILVAELRRGFSARIVGDPGGGKSVCAYQAAAVFAREGWRVQQLDDARGLTSDLPSHDGNTLYVVDDAHLASVGTLTAIEHAAGPRRLVLSIHNRLGQNPSRRGAVVIEPRKAVSTIAEGLRRDPGTLAAVRRVDPNVGDAPGDLDLSARIDHAEDEATYPWQFCFILGGGWGRAERDADAARAAGADIVLAAVAVHQIASRDARPLREEIEALATIAGLSVEQTRRAIEFLIRERLMIGEDDLRCPHQRFAVVVIEKILKGQDEAGRNAVGRLFGAVLDDHEMPFGGLYLLLHEIAFAGRYRQWGRFVPLEPLRSALKRALAADTSASRGDACRLLTQAETYVPDWVSETLRPNAAVFRTWFNELDAESAHGLSRLINNIHNRDKELAPELFTASDAEAVAAAISSATPETAFALGTLADRLWILGKDWNGRYAAALDRKALIGLARAWPKDSELYSLAELCGGLVADNNTLALDMVEAALPQIRQRLAKDPAGGFREIDEIAMHVLRVLDVLGVYTGKLAAGERERALARSMVADIDPKRLADQLSAVRLKQFQSTSFLLSFIARVDPRRFRATAAALDWDRLAHTIGEHWKLLPHDAEVLMGVAYGAPKGRERLRQCIVDNLGRIEVLPARLAVMFLSVAERALEQSKTVATGSFGHVHWDYVVALLKPFAAQRPDLVDALLAPAEEAAIEAFGQPNESWYKDAAPGLVALREHAPQALQRILDRLDPVRAEVGWTAAVRAGRGARRTIAQLVTAAIDRPDGIGDMARGLRARFPAKTVVDGQPVVKRGSRRGAG